MYVIEYGSCNSVTVISSQITIFTTLVDVQGVNGWATDPSKEVSSGVSYLFFVARGEEGKGCANYSGLLSSMSECRRL
jgi:hypothetical protein